MFYRLPRPHCFAAALYFLVPLSRHIQLRGDGESILLFSLSRLQKTWRPVLFYPTLAHIIPTHGLKRTAGRLTPIFCLHAVILPPAKTSDLRSLNFIRVLAIQHFALQ